MAVTKEVNSAKLWWFTIVMTAFDSYGAWKFGSIGHTTTEVADNTLSEMSSLERCFE